MDKSRRLFVVFIRGFVDRKNLIAAAAAGRSRGIIPAASFGGKKAFLLLAVADDSSKSRSSIYRLQIPRFSRGKQFCSLS